VVRFLHRTWALALVLATALIASPILRLLNLRWMTLTHTLIHLDGIALGSLLALGLYTLNLSRRLWLGIGLGALVVGLWATATIAGGTAFLDSALAFGFAGAVLAAVASTGARNPLNVMLRRGPLAFYGRISYGLRMDRYGVAGNLAVVVFRLAASTSAATVLWYGFEAQVLKLKRHF
jgi:hypothetical protein